MPLRLLGPWPLSLTGLQPAAAHALREAAAALGDGGSSGPDGSKPGLYVIVDDGNRTEVLGFWLTFGPSWVDEGPPGPPDTVPPYVEDLLEGAVSELWWKLPVRRRGGVWRPVVVFEWPDTVAQRSSVPPPGEPQATPTALADEEDPGEALWDPESDHPGHRPRSRPAPVQAVTRGPRRSLLTLITGELEASGTVHRGRYALARPAAADDAPQDWMEAISQTFPAEISEVAIPGPRLGLPGGREGYALPGWLTRGLELWPPSVALLRQGVLPEHQVGARWVQQSQRAFAATFAVVVAVALLGALLRFLANPTIYSTPPAQPEAPQPAMSLCSPDHHQFVSELRCQVAALAGAGTLSTNPVCGDAQSLGEGPDADLQAAWCGLLDRTLDGWTPGGDSPGFGEAALAQACFNVLGHPYAYRAQGAADGTSARVAVDARKLLYDPTLHVASATDLLKDLRESCALYRDRAVLRVDGEILATHIGRPWPTADGSTPVAGSKPSASSPPVEGPELRESAVKVASATLSAGGVRCLRTGVDQRDQPDRYNALCGAPDDDDRRQEKRAGWTALGQGAARGAVVERYMDARFGARSDAQIPDAVWRCRRALRRRIPALGLGSFLGRWELLLPLPTALDVEGHEALTSQLELEAGLHAVAAGVPGGACWEVLAERLTDWPTVHPMYAGQPKAWPSEEQQVCGAICAARYGIGVPGAPWVTPDADTRRCLNTGAPTTEPKVGFDRIGLPFSQSGTNAWIVPSTADICAFHLLAQGRVPGSVLGDDRDPAEWAGETAPRSGLAGGPEGTAVKAIRNMERFGAGAGFGVRSCRDVAAQCALATLLEVADPDSGVERFRWADRYESRLDELARAPTAELTRTRPWCVPVQAYLTEVKDMAIIDSPCQRGVAEARAAVGAFAAALVHGHAEDKGGTPP